MCTQIFAKYVGWVRADNAIEASVNLVTIYKTSCYSVLLNSGHPLVFLCVLMGVYHFWVVQLWWRGHNLIASAELKTCTEALRLLFWCALNLKMQKLSLSFSVGICDCKNQWYLKSKQIYCLQKNCFYMLLKAISLFSTKTNISSSDSIIKLHMNF